RVQDVPGLHGLLLGGRDLLVVDGREVEQGAGDVALVRVGRLEDAVAVGVAAQLGTGRIRPLDLSDDLTEGVAPATAVGLAVGDEEVVEVRLRCARGALGLGPGVLGVHVAGVRDLVRLELAARVDAGHVPAEVVDVAEHRLAGGVVGEVLLLLGDLADGALELLVALALEAGIAVAGHGTGVHRIGIHGARVDGAGVDGTRIDRTGVNGARIDRPRIDRTGIDGARIGRRLFTAGDLEPPEDQRPLVALGAVLDIELPLALAQLSLERGADVEVPADVVRAL